MEICLYILCVDASSCTYLTSMYSVRLTQLLGNNPIAVLANCISSVLRKASSYHNNTILCHVLGVS